MSQFQDLINSETPVLVDFTAEWCGPCKTMGPVLKEAAGQLSGRVRIIKVDVDRNPAVAAHYQVQGVPTFILFKSGRIRWRQSGAMPLNSILNAVEKNIS